MVKTQWELQFHSDQETWNMIKVREGYGFQNACKVKARHADESTCKPAIRCDEHLLECAPDNKD